MAITPVNLTEPKGLIPVGFLPDLETTLTEYIAQGYLEATGAGITDPAKSDQVATAYAYYRAFNAKYIQYAGIMEGGLGDADYKAPTSQARYFKGLADEWYNKYLDVIAIPAPPRRITSTHTSNNVTF
jgi:hypothetical protein